MNNRISNKRADIAWFKISSSDKFQALIKKYRKIANIPQNGFEEKSKKCKNFLSNLVNNNKKLDEINSYISKFNNEVKKINNYNKNFHNALWHYLIFNKINLKSINLTGCNLILLTREKNIEVRKKEFTEGLYLKISFDSSIGKIREYLEENRSLIKHFLRKEGGKNNIIIKRERGYKNIDRDYIIYELSKKSKEELKNLGGGVSNYKDILIQNVLKNISGYETSPENIRQIIVRQRKLRESSL